MSNLYQRSVEIILENQAPGGAFIACPNFPTYHFCWFRDGAYTAYAMDLAGQHDSARRFYQWAADQVNQRMDQVITGIQKAQSGQPLAESDILHTRYRLDGLPDEPGQWPNFQLDGFGALLWGMRQHIHLSGSSAPADWLSAASLVADYLSTLWILPCYDCWEEFPQHIHPYTLAAIYGGLQAHSQLSGVDHSLETTAIQDRLNQNAAEYGYFVKFSGSPEVDASLLGLAVPFGAVAPDDPRMRRTVERIEETLLGSGGVHRYTADTYYGGGSWILLSAWLGWYYKILARHEPAAANRAQERTALLQTWIEAQSRPENSWLPEQTPENLNDPSFYPEWINRWGPIATPLLWSHANTIIFLSH